MKILIIKTSSMGDIIDTLPALTDASEILKQDLRFDWVVEEGFAEIPRWHPLVNKIIPVALRRWRKQPYLAIKNGEWEKFYDLLRQEQYDYIIDAQGLLKSAILTRLSRGLRCGFDFNTAREFLAAFFYQKRFNIAKNQHAVTRTRELFSQVLNYTLPTSIPDYKIDTRCLLAHPELDPTKINLSRKTVLFIHGTSRADKYWPESHWIELAKLAQKAEYTVYIIWGSQEEKERSERIALACPSVHIAAKLKLSEVAALLSQISAAVAVDTGLGHLAAALGTPTVSLYGPTDPKLIGAYGPRQQHLSALDYSGQSSMEGLSVKTVWDVLIQKVLV